MGLAKINFDHLGIVFNILKVTLGQNSALMEHGDGSIEIANKFHIMLNDHNRMLSSQRFNQLSGANGFLIR